MRLIDADALENQNICDYCEKSNHCCEYECFNWYEEETVRKMIKQAQTIDAVPVVRCKDCKFNLANIEDIQNNININEGWNACYLTELYDSVCPDDYCSKGERKEVQE